MFFLLFSALVGDDELSFDAGVLIMLKTRVGSNWLRGRLVDGSEGIFPKEYVEIVVSTLQHTICCVKIYFSVLWLFRRNYLKMLMSLLHLCLKALHQDPLMDQCKCVVLVHVCMI